jgi:tetratricopeptide (TPR) repeat protein
MAEPFSAAVTPPFVGRFPELAALEGALDEAADGRGSLFLVSGEPGIGKSRLTDEAAARARERGFVVLWGRCWEAGGAPPYWPWVQSIRGYLRDRHPGALAEELGPGAADIARIMPEIGEMLPGLPLPIEGDPESVRFRLFDSTAAFLRRAATQRPVLLVLDDVHAADVPSLLMLRFLGGEIGSARLVLLAVYRDTDLQPGHPLLEAAAELARLSWARRIPLRGLDEGDVARLIEEGAGTVPLTSLVSTLHRETEGNPLFVGEVVRLLATEDRLSGRLDAEAWSALVAKGLRAVIRMRLARLSTPSRSVLTVASVFGREFNIDSLVHATGTARDELLRVLDEAARARVIAEVPGSVGRMRFSHALVGEALYDDLGPAERIRLHQVVGEALERTYGPNLESHLGELAHHFVRAAPGGVAERAVEFARRAGERAATILAYEEAVRLYGLALEALSLTGVPNEAARCNLLLSLGDVQARAGEAEQAKRSFLGAAEIAREHSMAEHLARAALGYGGRFVWEAARGDSNLETLLEDALAALGETDSELRVRVLARLAGGPRWDRFERDPRDRLSGEAVEMARRLGDPSALAWALDGRYAAVWWPENLDERVTLATELVRVSREAGDKERELQGHHYLCLCLLERGDMGGVREELEAKARLAEELRQPAQLWYLEAVRATLATLQGAFPQAEQLVERTFILGQRAERAMAVIYRAIGLYMLRREQGRLHEVEDAIRRGIRDFPTYFVLRCALAQLCTEIEREAEAREIFEALSRGDFGRLARNDEWLFSMCLLAEVAEHIGDSGRAATLYELLLPFERRTAVAAPEGCTGSIARNLGILAMAMGRWDAAERHFDDAVRMNEGMGARPWAAHTRFAYGRMLLSRADDGQRARAITLLSEALGAARDLGMVTLERGCADLLAAEGIEVKEAGRRITRTFMFTDIGAQPTSSERSGTRPGIAFAAGTTARSGSCSASMTVLRWITPAMGSSWRSRVRRRRCGAP